MAKFGGNGMVWITRLTAALVIGLSLGAAPTAQAGNLNVRGRFVNAGVELDVATYAAPNDKGVEERVLLLGIKSAGHAISIAVERTEAHTLQALWNQAESQQSDEWRYVGDFTETGTRDVSHLKVSAGPGVRYIIESPAKGASTADLSRSDMKAFGSALDEAVAYVQSSN